MFKVKSNTNPNKLAGAITITLRERKTVELQCIGAASVNQATKAIIIANGFLNPVGMEMQIKPSFYTIEIEGMNRTCIKFSLDIKGNEKENLE